jgi:hypothetical protein
MECVMEDQKVDFTKIKEYRDKINQLLAERPEYAHFQKEIDEALERAGKSHTNRMSVLMSMMMDKRIELMNKFKDLLGGLEKFQKTVQGIKDEIGNN